MRFVSSSYYVYNTFNLLIRRKDIAYIRESTGCTVVARTFMYSCLTSLISITYLKYVIISCGGGIKQQYRPIIKSSVTMMMMMMMIVDGKVYTHARRITLSSVKNFELIYVGVYYNIMRAYV